MYHDFKLNTPYIDGRALHFYSSLQITLNVKVIVSIVKKNKKKHIFLKKTTTVLVRNVIPDIAVNKNYTTYT